MGQLKKHLSFFFTILLSLSAFSYAQNKIPEKSNIFIDKVGIMRWQADSSEVSLFGVNYTAPFAYSYRAIKKLNLSLKQAIDIDVEQMKRLGFNAFRVHVWDREISDENGNLINNEHLELFDYLLKRLSDNGIKSIITPIAWWGNGYPEPDEKTKGFSENYSKQDLITNPKAIEAQKNYLKAFMTHRNKYSGYVYKDDPSIIAVEIINEPKHPADTALVTRYINELASAIRQTNYNKPIFYNISENWSDLQANAVTKANIDGVSFQWYPTALVHNHMLDGNFLLNVDSYKIPSENVKGFGSKAKMVYEFDAADVGASYMYPAMVRSFRKAGMQFAAMFSYDPTQIAWSNTEYPTHFMNLLYAPSKAISLMIATKAFMKLPLYKDFGNYPDNARFGDFRVSYEENLSEMNSPEEFYYSNNTKSSPVEIEKLQHIAGCGSSPVISYDGTGAYFLDKIKDDLWKLEVNPDVVWINDPFGKNSLRREVARLYYSQSTMKIILPGLSDNFYINAIDAGNKLSQQKSNQREFKVKPGIYLISNDKLSSEVINNYRKKSGLKLPVYTPPDNKKNIVIINNTIREKHDSGPVTFSFTVATKRDISQAILYIKRRGWRGFESYRLNKTGKYTYSADITSSSIKNGFVEYCLCLNDGINKYTFPGMVKGSLEQWDFSTEKSWTLVDRNDPGNRLWYLSIHDIDEHLTIYDAYRDSDELLFPHWSQSQKYFIDYTFSHSNPVVRFKVQLTGQQTKPFSFMNNVAKHLKLDKEALSKYNTLVLKGRSAGERNIILQVNLLFTDGSCTGSDIVINNRTGEIEIPIASMIPRERMILPDCYPLFLIENRKVNIISKDSAVDLNKLDFLQISCIDNEESPPGKSSTMDFEIESVYLKK